MKTEVELVEVWAASMVDKPGALASALSSLREAGANLEFVVARRSAETPGKGVAFVAPIRGDKQIAVASKAGFNATATLHAVRVRGDDVPGVAAQLTMVLAEAGINLRGFSAAVLAGQFVAYFGFDSSDDAHKAARILGKA